VLWGTDQTAQPSTPDKPLRITPGCTIVVPATYGGITDNNWDPTGTEPVSDVATAAAFAARRSAVLRLHPSLVSAAGVINPASVEGLNSSETQSVISDTVLGLTADDVGPGSTAALEAIQAALA